MTAAPGRTIIQDLLIVAGEEVFLCPRLHQSIA
jgi:hypothetical protein